MKEITRDIISAFCEHTKVLCVGTEAVQSVKFTYEEIVIDGLMKSADGEERYFMDFTEISLDLSLQQLVRMLRSLSKTDEGTTVIFIHSFEKGLVERLASICGFRVDEHFSITRVVKELCGEQEDREISYCCAVRKTKL